MDTDILLQSGTNELQLLEFFVGGERFGINIAKVSELMSYRPVTPMPEAPAAVEGIFMPRDKLISVVNLHTVLGVSKPEGDEGMLIICSFNGLDIAFHVTGVSSMRRISWSDIEKPPQVSQYADAGLVTGVAKTDSGMILILDFEKIVSDLNKSAGLDTDGVDRAAGKAGVDYEKHIVIAEDSALLNKMIMDALHTAGFRNIMSFSNGKDAWDYISGYRELGADIRSEVALLVTDIEMPQMDGHHLTKLIKDDDVLKVIPVFLFSSLIDDRMRAKGREVGADEQFSKPQIGALTDKLGDYLTK